MASQGRTILKSYFETGDRPTQAQFADLIDSVFNLDDDDINDIVGATGVEVENVSDRTALKTNTNWVNPNSSGDAYYPIMTQNQPTGYPEGAYYWGFDDTTNTYYRYVYEKRDGSLQWNKMIGAMNVPTS